VHGLHKPQAIAGHAYLARVPFQTCKALKKSSFLKAQILIALARTDPEKHLIEVVQATAESPFALAPPKGKTGNNAPGGRQEPNPAIILPKGSYPKYDNLFRELHEITGRQGGGETSPARHEA
jgi:hypothetical protein